MTENQEEVLANLEALDGGDSIEGSWWRPMDFGGSNSSHHSQTARRLAKLGWVEHTPKPQHMERGSLRYRITEQGRIALRNHRAMKGRKATDVAKELSE